MASCWAMFMRTIISPRMKVMTVRLPNCVTALSFTVNRIDLHSLCPLISAHYSVAGSRQSFDEKSIINPLNESNHKERDSSSEETTGRLLESLLNDELIPMTSPPAIEQWEEIGSRSALDKSVRNWNFRLLKCIAYKMPGCPDLYPIAESLYKYSVCKHGRKNLFLDSQLILASVSHGGKEGMQQGMKLYDELMNTYEIIDGLTATTLVRALSQTNRWKECFHLIEVAKLSGPVQPQNYVQMIIAANRVGDRNTVEEMCSILNVNNQTTELTECNVNSLLKPVKSVEELDTFFYVFDKLNKSVLRENIGAIKDKINSDMNASGGKWRAKEVIISTAHNNGKCGECGNQLEETPPISAEDFSKMRDLFLEKAVIREDVYLNSIPKELADFQKFIEEHSHFDVVLDGLNIAFTGGKKESASAKGVRLLSAVKTFAVDKKMKVLIIGRNHMNSWAGIQKVKKLGTCYFTQNLSNDDPFLLYSAMCCGQDTLLVTRDYMRNHSFVLGPEMQAVFRQWQSLRQIVPFSRRGQVAFKWPSLYARKIQKTPCGWHIPFEDERPTSQFVQSQSWLCLQHSQ